MKTGKKAILRVLYTDLSMQLAKPLDKLKIKNPLLFLAIQFAIFFVFQGGEWAMAENFEFAQGEGFSMLVLFFEVAAHSIIGTRTTRYIHQEMAENVPQ